MPKQPRRTIKVKVKCRKQDDPVLIINAMGYSLGGQEANLSVEIEPVDEADPIKPGKTPNERLETEIAKSGNERAKQRRGTLRKAGKDPDKRIQASAVERLEKRSRVRAFGGWLNKATGAAIIKVVVTAAAKVLGL